MQRIFVGDVQGCGEELALLVDRARDAFGDEFSLWVAGDLVNRGPENMRALELVRDLVEAGRAEYILGNHEIHLIAAHWGQRPLSENDSIDDVLDSAEAEDWVEWIRRLPLAVGGELDGHPFVMLHASAGAAWTRAELLARAAAARARLSADDQEEARAFLATDPEADPVREDLARLTRGRAGSALDWSSLEPETPEGAWHHAWRAAGPDYGIIYGHWARQGLHVAPGLRGLDTGCVHHGRGRDGFLTAWLPESSPRSPEAADAFDVPDDRFWQIPARRRYYYPTQDRA